MKKPVPILHVLIILFLILTTSNKELHAKVDNAKYEDYYKICNEALAFKVNKELKKAIDKYEEAFTQFLPFIDDLIELKDCYKQMGDSIMVKKVWERMISSGFVLEGKSYLVEPSSPLKCEWSKAIPKDEKDIFSKINYDSLHHNYLLKVDVEKSKYLQAIVVGECFVGIMRAQAENDKKYKILVEGGYSTVGKLFINLAKSKYTPSRQESYIWNDNVFITTLIHIAGTLQGNNLKEFLSILKEHVYNGNLAPNQYASIYDHANYKNTLYGACFEFNESGEKIIVSPKDIDNVDKHRADIFLPPLWIGAKQKGLILPPKYKPNM